jgi:hypothetical protein
LHTAYGVNNGRLRTDDFALGYPYSSLDLRNDDKNDRFGLPLKLVVGEGINKSKATSLHPGDAISVTAEVSEIDPKPGRISVSLRKLRHANFDPKGEPKKPQSPLLEALAESYPQDRDEYLKALEKSDPDVYKHAVALRVDQNFAVKRDALLALVKMGDKAEPVVPFLVDLYVEQKTGKSPVTRPSPITAMASIAPKNPVVVAAVLDALKVTPESAQPGPTIAYLTQKDIRKAAIEASRNVSIDGDKLTEALVSALADTDTANRLAIIKRLEEMGQGAAKALPALDRLKLDENATIRDAATKAVEKLSRK